MGRGLPKRSADRGAERVTLPEQTWEPERQSLRTTTGEASRPVRPARSESTQPLDTQAIPVRLLAAMNDTPFRRTCGGRVITARGGTHERESEV